MQAPKSTTEDRRLPAPANYKKLSTQTKTLDQSAVAHDVRLGQVAKQTTTLTHEDQQTTT